MRANRFWLVSLSFCSLATLNCIGVRIIYSDKEIISFAERFTSSVESIELLGQSHNTVYKITCRNSFILRVTPLCHRSRNEIVSELDFLIHLHENGATVSSPLLSLTGDLVIGFQSDSGDGHISAFTIAEGLDWRTRDNDHISLEHIGRSHGKIHKESRNYDPVNFPKRRQYFESQHLKKAAQVFRKANPKLVEYFESYLADLSVMTKSPLNYGLTHGDFLFSNYNITSDNKVTVFDFDECEYSWYINDIAICVYYYLLGGDPTELNKKSEEAEQMVCSLMKGYLAEYPLPLEELEKMNLLFSMRDYILLSTIYERDHVYRKWEKDFIGGAVDRITNKRHFIELNMRSISRMLKG